MEYLKAIPSWLLLAVVVYLAVLISYAVYDDRRIDFWPPSIHSREETLPLEKDHRYIAITEQLKQSEKGLAELRNYKENQDKSTAHLLSKVKHLKEKIKNIKFRPNTCITKKGKLGRVQLKIAIFNKDKTLQTHGEADVRDAGKWLFASTQLMKASGDAFALDESRVGVKWKCMD